MVQGIRGVTRASSVAIAGLHISRAAAAAAAAATMAATLLHQLDPEAGRMSRIRLIVTSKPMGQLTI